MTSPPARAPTIVGVRMLLLIVATLLAPLAGRAGQPPADAGGEGELARVAGAVSGRLVLVEVVKRDGDKESVALSQPGLVIGPRTVMTVAPRISKAATAGAEVRISQEEEGGRRRQLAAKLLKIDPQTGLGVFQADGLGGPATGCLPAPEPKLDSPVFLVEPAGEGKLNVRRAKIVQSRAYLDQGLGKNFLFLVRLDEREKRRGRSYSRWDDPLAAGTGSFLADARGGFLGMVTPPALEAASRSEKEKDGKEKGDKKAAADIDPPRLREGELLVLPGEIAQLVSESLAQGKAPVRGFLGASFREVAKPPEEVRRLGAASPAVQVHRVSAHGPAEQGGLQAGDWLLAIEKNRSTTYADVIRFSELVEYGGQGKEIHLLVARGAPGQLKTHRLTIRIGLR